MMEICSERRDSATLFTPESQRFDGREMAMVHRVFRREFLLAAGVVRQVACGDAERARIVAAHLRFIGTTLNHHHSGEDCHIWPLLECRASAHVSEHVRNVVQQHHQVDAAQAAVTEELAIWTRCAAADSRDRLAAALDRLAVALVDHMDYEERHVVPVMEEHIGLEEWNRIVQSMTAALDPSEALLAFGMSAYEGDPDLIELVVENMPPEVRVGIRVKAADVYAAHARLVYGSPTPPHSTEIRR